MRTQPGSGARIETPASALAVCLDPKEIAAILTAGKGTDKYDRLVEHIQLSPCPDCEDLVLQTLIEIELATERPAGSDLDG
jgi:hypothetical protein